MKAAGEGSRSPLNRLGVRLGLLLSFAILPIGVIAVWQSYRTVEQSQERSEAALLGAVGQAVSTEQQLIQTALGAAAALGHSILPILEDAARCRAILSSYIASAPDFIFAGFIEADGRMRCASSGLQFDYSGSELFERVTAAPVPAVGLNERDTITGKPVLMVTHPVQRNGALRGYMSISLPYEELEVARQPRSWSRPLDLISFNRDGLILTADGDVANAEMMLPADARLTGFVDRGAIAFTGTTRSGVPRVFAVAPIVEGEVYAIGSWPVNARFVRPEVFSATVLAFPVLMWLASIAVAYFGLHRLVIGHLGTLRSAMRRFALGSRDLAPLKIDAAPNEIRDIGETFERMRQIITRDEAELENALHEREVLLKEVHHRVKNNLQLITSIISMQIRQTNTPEVRAMLRRVQERVMSLATIHRSLYETTNLTNLRVDGLIREILNQMVSMSAVPGSNIAIRCNLDPVALDPDQAVPLSLVVSEAVTNALKYFGVPEGADRPWIAVDMAGPDATGMVRLEVANSLGRNPHPDGGMPGTGIGGKLIEAFAAQLDATVSHSDDADSFSLAIEFPVRYFQTGEMDRAAAKA